jgi:hypothetical protein
VLKLGEGVSGTQLVEIVYDQHNASGHFAKFGYDRVDHHFAGKRGRSHLPLGISDGVCLTDRVQDGEPELLSILLVTGHRHEGDPAILAGSVRPRTQKRGLPASRRRRDDGHLPQGGAIERRQEAISMKETCSAGNGP